MAKVIWYGDMVEREVTNKAEQALDKIALLVERDAKILCPVDKGRLRGSITHEREGLVARVGTNTFYAPYVFLGTSKMAARPTLRPAMEKNVAAANRILGGVL